MKIWKDKDKAGQVVWKSDFTYKGKKYRPSAYTEDGLNDLIKQIRSNADRAAVGLVPDAVPVNLLELVAEHVRDFDYSIEYYRRAKVVFEMFRDHIGGDVPVKNLATADYRSYIRFRRTQNPKLQNSSVNKDLTYLSKLLSTAHEYFRELDGFNPPKVPWLSESTKPNDRTIYEEEAETLLDFLRFPGVHAGEKPNSPQIRGDYADMLELALNSAMRWAEVAQLEWSMVNLPASEIILPKRVTKTDEPRSIPLNSRVKQIIAGRAKEKASEVWLFPRADGKSYRKYYADRLGSIAKKLGLPFGRGIGFTLHTTRHTAITSMQQGGAEIATVQKISGHSDRTMTLRYSHASKKRTLDAVESLVKKRGQNGK